MGSPERAARAGFALAALLFAAGLRWGPADRSGSECRDPAELAAEGGWTRQVACGAAASGLPGLRGPARRLFGLPLDLNRADALALETLPGVGPVRAEAIVRERSRRGFASVAELTRVPGIGPRTAAKLSGLLAVGPSREER